VPEPIPSVENAEAEYERCRAEYGPEDPKSLAAELRLARAYCDAGRYRTAEGLYSTALAVRGRLFGFDDPSAISTGFGLGSTYMRSETWTSARPVLEDLLERSDRVYGKDSDYTRRIAINLAITYRQLGRYGDELPLRQRILAGARKTLGSDGIDAAHSLVDLANVLENLNNHEMAIAVNEEAIAGLEANGATIREILLRRWHIAEELVALRRPDEASVMFEQVLKDVERLDADDPFRRRARKQRRTFSLLARLSGRGKITAP
jgi:tetratricopeptide (TPR) repeat protein